MNQTTDDEINRRESAAIVRRQRPAKFEEQVTLEGFGFKASNKLPTAVIRDLATLNWLHEGSSIILYGPVGVGKTHVAQSLGQLVIRAGYDVRFIKASRALAHLSGGHADGSWPKRLAELARPAVLILDDWAMRELKPAQTGVSERAVTRKPLILTSNQAPKDWYPLFPNNVVGESLLDLLINNSYQVLMDGPSYRPNKRPGRPTASADTDKAPR